MARGQTRFTERLIEGSTSGGAKDRLMFDAGCPGLGLRITPASKTFLVQWTDRATGGKQREVIGRWGALSLDQARIAARVALGKVAAGENPRTTRLQARAAARIATAERAFTVDQLITRWAADHLAGRKPGYATEAERALRRALAGVLDHPAAKLARGDALAPLQALAEAGKATTAARVLSYGRAAFGWALARDLVPHNPFLRLPIAPAANARERVPTLAETREIWAAADTLGPPFGPAVKILVLTLCRRDEVGRMRWDELDAAHAVWTLPGVRAKNGQPHAVTLPDAARAALADLPRWEGSPFAFSTSGRAPVSGWSKAKPRLDRAIAAARTAAALSSGTADTPMPHWTLHDLRRGGATWLAGQGVDITVVERLLNHVPAALRGVAGVYNRYQHGPECAAALRLWAAAVTGGAVL